MKNLEITGVRNLDKSELQETEGGVFMIIAGVLGIYSGLGLLAYGAGYAYGKLTK